MPQNSKDFYNQFITSSSDELHAIEIAVCAVRIGQLLFSLGATTYTEKDGESKPIGVLLMEKYLNARVTGQFNAINGEIGWAIFGVISDMDAERKADPQFETRLNTLSEDLLGMSDEDFVRLVDTQITESSRNALENWENT